MNSPQWKKDEYPVLGSVSGLVGLFNYFTRDNLKSLCVAHCVHCMSQATKLVMISALTHHSCRGSCPELIHTFCLRTQVRYPPSSTNNQKAFDLQPSVSSRLASVSQPPSELQSMSQSQTSTFLHETSPASNNNTHEYPMSHLEILSDKQLSEIVTKWRNTMSSSQLKRVVCASCSELCWRTNTKWVPLESIDLRLLYNATLPPCYYPKSYDMLAYENAILDPQGMSSVNERGNLLLCKVCLRSLRKNQTPKFALSNGLYYAYEVVDAKTRQAFSEATPCEKMCIARARFRKINYKISSLHKDGTINPASSQNCMRGNVVIIPQDSMSLQRLLPPSRDIIRDTVCVVFVGKVQPSAETIRSLTPLLIRKERVRTMLNYLMKHNDQYKPSADFDGISQENLDALFDDRNQEEGIPSCVTIGHIENNETLEAATSGYDDRRRDDNVSDDNDDADHLLMENVAYTCGDSTPQSYLQMKIAALTRCYQGKNFIHHQSGSTPVNDFENEHVLTWCFPSIDPHNIGGFNRTGRTRRISPREQLAHMIRRSDRVFSRDEDAPAVFYNIERKREVHSVFQFRAPSNRYNDIIRRLMSLNPKVLLRLSDALARNTDCDLTDEERQAIHLLHEISALGHSIEGTAGHKLIMRNQIRGLINFYGTPCLFVTLNPADVHNPIVRILAGEDINLENPQRGEDMSSWRRKLLVAKNPATAALFFDKMIQGFIDVILGYGSKHGGIFGHCEAYYGSVESQARGTLHCHMPIWLRGHPNPQELRDRLNTSKDYFIHMKNWLESVIKCEEFGTTTVISELCGPLPPPRYVNEACDDHPGTLPIPDLAHTRPDLFRSEFELRVNDIVRAFNWHAHSATCFKYAKSGAPKDDAHCRMRIDGSTVSETHLELDTGAIVLRRLHPRIAPYNPVISFLMQCNNDVKFIGSGEAAKAVLYYITDYCTKPPVPMHEGLAALMHAIQRISEKLPGIVDDPENVIASNSRRAIITTVNSMLGRQELSHQQIMHYILRPPGKGDSYTNESFAPLFWGVFDRLFNHVFPHSDMGLEGKTLGPDDDITEWNKDVILTVGKGTISATSQVCDYMYRSESEPFNDMCVYELVGCTRKITKTYTSEYPLSQQKCQRGGFSSPAHPQAKTHLLQHTKAWCIPTLMGDRTPRYDRDADEREKWARMMLILFVPWRVPAAIKKSDESWLQAYQRQKHMISSQCQAVIANMNVLSQCKDARDEHAAQRRKERRTQGSEAFELNNQPFTEGLETHEDYSRRDTIDDLDGEMFNGVDWDEDLGEKSLATNTPKYLDPKYYELLDKCYGHCTLLPGETGNSTICSNETERDESAYQVEDGSSFMEIDMSGVGLVECSADNEIQTDEHFAALRELGKKRRPESNTVSQLNSSKHPRIDRDAPARVTVQSMAPTAGYAHADQPAKDRPDAAVIGAIKYEMDLNTEQERAFCIVAEHASYSKDQLLMYVAGVGGTGKSYVIQSIQEYFHAVGRSNELFLGAPTGAAATVIGGSTLHSLLLINEFNPKKPFFGPLRDVWQDVNYLIVDEVSMISAQFLSQISMRLKQARGEISDDINKPFGGMNVVFFGDFGQLKPVGSKALFSHELVRTERFLNMSDADGVGNMQGAFLWRQIDTVVVLTHNMRQRLDGPYADLLSRIRIGEAILTTRGSSKADFETLSDRELMRLHNSDAHSLSRFYDAPIIVGSRVLRDELNSHIVRLRAKNAGRQLHTYYCEDYFGKVPVPEAEREILLNYEPRAKNKKDVLARLPLFVGARVMITTNLAISNRIVNGSEGIVTEIRYTVDSQRRRVANAVYVHVPNSGRIHKDLPEDVVPVYPVGHLFSWNHNDKSKKVRREQIPLLPAYAYTDYKSQGRTLETAIVDLHSARSLQGVYVMLSRAKQLENIAVLRNFPSQKVNQRAPQELREELARIEGLDVTTRDGYQADLLQRARRLASSART
jgi:hypothetical protein